MAKRGTSKYKSVQQEQYIALIYGGKQSPSSGAADNDQGDVRTPTTLIECKVTGGPGKGGPRSPRMVRWLEKVSLEAWEEGRDPALALRFYDPESALADRDGWIDLVVRLASDDSVREDLYNSVLDHRKLERARTEAGKEK